MYIYELQDIVKYLGGALDFNGDFPYFLDKCLN